jgi:hypothetical protein
MSKRPKPFANTIPFYTMLGLFYAAHSSAELTLDCAICRVLKLTPEQTHVLVATWEYGRKAAVLRSLLKGSAYNNKEAEIKGYLTKIGKSLRNTFAHSFLASDEHHVTFVHRTATQGEYSCIGYNFTPDGFGRHVQDFVQLAHDFEKALGLSHSEIAEFAAAAVREEKSA